MGPLTRGADGTAGVTGGAGGAAGGSGGRPSPDAAPARKTEPVPKQQTEKAPAVAAKKEHPAAKTAAASVRYTIQTGSYSDRSMAEEEVRSLKRRGYAAFFVATNIPEKGTWYRVRIGSFANRESAERLANDLKAKEGVPAIVSKE